MADDRRPRATSESADSGFDVWLPAFVAVLAAIFMILSAHAQTAPEPVAAPRMIFNPSRFDAGAIDRQAAAAAIARGDYQVEVAPPERPTHLMAGHVVIALLPDIAMPGAVVLPAPDTPPPFAAASGASDDHNMFERTLAIGSIAGLLIVTLLLMARTWRRSRNAIAV